MINGEVYNENKNFPEISNAGLASDGVSLESGEYFVLGDNRINSEDSRYGDIGNINKKYIVGKVWFVISPKDKFGFCVATMPHMSNPRLVNTTRSGRCIKPILHSKPRPSARART